MEREGYDISLPRQPGISWFLVLYPRFHGVVRWLVQSACSIDNLIHYMDKHEPGIRVAGTAACDIPTHSRPQRQPHPPAAHFTNLTPAASHTPTSLLRYDSGTTTPTHRVFSTALPRQLSINPTTASTTPPTPQYGSLRTRSPRTPRGNRSARVSCRRDRPPNSATSGQSSVPRTQRPHRTLARTPRVLDAREHENQPGQRLAQR